jgi:hypothetical protein
MAILILGNNLSTFLILISRYCHYLSSKGLHEGCYVDPLLRFRETAALVCVNHDEGLHYSITSQLKLLTVKQSRLSYKIDLGLYETR